MVAQNEGKSFHEWFIEFDNIPDDLPKFSKRIDESLREKNIYYDDLISGNILEPLKVNIIRKNGFIDYMKSIGKLGVQNKVPRLSNDRNLAAELEKYTE